MSVRSEIRVEMRDALWIQIRANLEAFLGLMPPQDDEDLELVSCDSVSSRRAVLQFISLMEEGSPTEVPMDKPEATL